jgi:uncharacterized membrane protein YoaK (UPF0700 family)
MFRHRGKSRTYIHNLRLASLLSFVAGVVNITGVLAVKVLTTNVTGHFAYFSEDIFMGNYQVATIYIVFVLAFLLGAFLSNFLIEVVPRKHESVSYTVPLAIEITLLCLVGLFGRQSSLLDAHGQLISCAMLFAMGLQNALVTKVSQSVVRTTHLTGLFTDLGIELSELFFYRDYIQRKRLHKSIFLKLVIIGCFFFGCLLGGMAYKTMELKTLLVAACALVFTLFYDNIRMRYFHLKKKIQSWQ